jgi:signal transduction histidine kinase
MSVDKKNRRLFRFSLIVIGYMALALSWWTVLLYNKNNDAFKAKTELLNQKALKEGKLQTGEKLYSLDEYRELHVYYNRQRYMIIGEGAVFLASLIAGIYFIRRGYIKEMESIRERRNFLLSITHELKSPIASIRLALETMIKRDLNKEQNQKLQTNALFETERLNQLVTDLLLSARLESTYTPNKEPLDIGELLENIIEKLRSKYPDAAFKFSQTDDLPYVGGDKLGLTSVALNLLENAVKYSRPAKPEIETHLLKDENGQVVITIADQGIGIAEGEKANIFKKFYRVGSEETRTTKGTGLGLFIVDQIVTAHGGRIEVMDNVPKGTIFEIHLPVDELEPA